MGRETDSGIKLLTKITSIRWFGWGLGETFIPIFILLFSANFFETGLLTSIYYVMFFLFIPISGYLADKIKIKYILILGLSIYIFIGVGYFLAGFTGMIIFLILARMLNGISYSLDQVGRETYFVRHVSKKNESESFGRFDKITTFWWVLAVLVGILLINYVDIHWLLLAVTPTSIIALFLTLKLKEKPVKKTKQKIKNPYVKIFREVKNFNSNLKNLSVMVFFFSMMSSIVYYFAPAVSYFRGESMINSVILVLAYSFPSLFGEKLGKFADKIKVKGYYLSLISLIFVLIILAFSPNYYLLLFSMFFAGMTFELTSLTNKGFMARNSAYNKVGEVDSVLNGIGSLGSIIGPIVFGFLLDLLNPMHSYFSAILLVLVMFGFVYRMKDK
ncbi:MFS transporter [archaeon]|nr:MFS transporter [archaeon]